MAVLRYEITTSGAITFIGNTLGLSSASFCTPGTEDRIGVYGAESGIVCPLYAGPNTLTFTDNQTCNLLTLPPGSSVLYAELIWAGSSRVPGEDNTAFVNDPISFVTPSTSMMIAPDPVTATDWVLPNGNLGYVRSQDVTSLVQEAGAGTYCAGSIVGTTVTNNPTNHAGWTLAVVYENFDLRCRNMTLFVLGAVLGAGSPPVDVELTGFNVPPSGIPSARMMVSTGEGDANKGGDMVLLGPLFATPVSGPNNCPNNFFASQINNDTGNLNTNGTFGTLNQNSGAPGCGGGSNIPGGRQGWDITNVDVSSFFSNNQNSTTVRFTTNNDGYIVNGLALQIDSCPSSITVDNDPGECGAIVNYCMPDSCTPPSGSFFNVGETFISCPNQCEFSVIVLDVEPPVIHTPEDIVVSVPAGESGAIVNYTVSATDNCSVSSLECTPLSGSFFEIGSTTVECKATDPSDNMATASFTITVLSEEPRPPSGKSKGEIIRVPLVYDWTILSSVHSVNILLESETKKDME